MQSNSKMYFKYIYMISKTNILVNSNNKWNNIDIFQIGLKMSNRLKAKRSNTTI